MALRNVAIGAYVMVRHRGEAEYQERLVTFVSKADPRLVMMTPDEDHYAVEPTREFDAVYVLGPRRGLPSTIRKAAVLVYRFDETYDDDELARIFAEARDIARDAKILEPRKRGRPAALDDRDGASDVGAAGALVPRLPVADGGDLGGVWLLSEPTEFQDVGLDVTDCVLPATRSGVFALCQLRGQMLKAEYVKAGEVARWATAAGIKWDSFARARMALLTPRGADAEVAVADARVLACRLDELGRREVRFEEATREMSEKLFPDWDLDGPRTVRYCCRQVAKTGAPPMTRFRTWKHENRLADDDPGVDFCDIASEVLELAVTRDQLDVSNLMCMERLERKRQMIEESYRQRAEELKLQKAISTNPMAVTAELYSGRPRMAGGAIVDPSLIEFVAKRAAESSDILRQQRKALEARGVAAPKAAGKK